MKPPSINTLTIITKLTPAVADKSMLLHLV